jgi:hypothetical protein
MVSIMPMPRNGSVNKLRTVLTSYVIVGSLAGACYNAKSPLLPPCNDKNAVWPDPCADRKADAGAADSATEGGFR